MDVGDRTDGSRGTDVEKAVAALGSGEFEGFHRAADVSGDQGAGGVALDVKGCGSEGGGMGDGVEGAEARCGDSGSECAMCGEVGLDERDALSDVGNVSECGRIGRGKISTEDIVAAGRKGAN